MNQYPARSSIPGLAPAAIVLGLVLVAPQGQDTRAADPPYPPSERIVGFELDWSTHRRAAPGSDNWPMTWAADGHQYTAWGDGGGFGGTNADGRVSLGVARVEGSWHDFRGKNLWGGKDPIRPAEFAGKS